jgi:hypothetical protein
MEESRQILTSRLYREECVDIHRVHVLVFDGSRRPPILSSTCSGRIALHRCGYCHGGSVLEIACRLLRISFSIVRPRPLSGVHRGWWSSEAKSEVESKGTCTMPEIRTITVEKHLMKANLSIDVPRILLDLVLCSLSIKLLCCNHFP